MLILVPISIQKRLIESLKNMWAELKRQDNSHLIPLGLSQESSGEEKMEVRKKDERIASEMREKDMRISALAGELEGRDNLINKMEKDFEKQLLLIASLEKDLNNRNGEANKI